MSPNEWIVPIALLLMLAPLFAKTAGPVQDAIWDHYSEDEDTTEGVEEITPLSSAPLSRHGEYLRYPVSAP